MIIFALMFTAVTGSIHFYLWKRLIFDTRPGRRVKIVGTVLIVALALSIPGTMIFSRSVSPDVTATIATIPLLWLGTVLFLMVSLILFDCYFLIRFLTRKIAQMRPSNDDRVTDPSKRDSLRKFTAVGTLGLSGTLTTASHLAVLHKPTVIHQEFTLSRLPPDLNGLKIAQLSDIHIGLTLDSAYLSQVVQQTNALAPDVIVITGDLIDGYVSKMKEDILPVTQLKAPMGVYFVTGNHEYYFNAHEWVDALKKMGIVVLSNQSVLLGSGKLPLMLAGVNDFEAHRFPQSEPLNLTRALKGRHQNQEVILLSHQPRIIQEAANADVGLVLSGHTHGGQIWPFNYLVKLQQPYIKGRVRYTHRTHLYINQGTGYWGPPMRLGTVSEITLITLHNKEF